MAKDLKYVVVDGALTVTDGTGFEVLAEYLHGKSLRASTQEEAEMTHAQSQTLEQASAQSVENTKETEQAM